VRGGSGGFGGSNNRSGGGGGFGGSGRRGGVRNVRPAGGGVRGRGRGGRGGRGGFNNNTGGGASGGSNVSPSTTTTVKLVKKVPEVKKEVPSAEVLEISKQLNETNNMDDLIRVWNILGAEKTREAVKETLEIESKGGLTVEIKHTVTEKSDNKTVNEGGVPKPEGGEEKKEEGGSSSSTKLIEKVETRKRTPGGVFFHLVKTKYATPEQVAMIFKSGKRKEKTKFKKMVRERERYVREMKKLKKVKQVKKVSDAAHATKTKKLYVKKLTTANDYDDPDDVPNPKQRGGQRRTQFKKNKRGK